MSGKIIWWGSEAHWAVYDDSSVIIGFYVTYGEALEAFNNYENSKV